MDGAGGIVFSVHPSICACMCVYIHVSGRRHSQTSLPLTSSYIFVCNESLADIAVNIYNE